MKDKRFDRRTKNMIKYWEGILQENPETKLEKSIKEAIKILKSTIGEEE